MNSTPAIQWLLAKYPAGARQAVAASHEAAVIALIVTIVPRPSTVASSHIAEAARLHVWQKRLPVVSRAAVRVLLLAAMNAS